MTPSTAGDRPADAPPLALGGRAILPGLAVGHAVFHWIVQSFVVVLPEIQQAFVLSGVGVGGVLAAREVATGLMKLPGGIVADQLRKYWGTQLVACLAAAAIGAVLIGISPAHQVVLAGVVLVAASHSLSHLPPSAAPPPSPCATSPRRPPSPTIIGAAARRWPFTAWEGASAT